MALEALVREVLLAAMAYFLLSVLAAMALVVVYLYKAALGLSQSMALWLVRGFFFLFLIWEFSLMGLIAVWISLELITLAMSALDNKDLFNEYPSFPYPAYP